MKIKPTGQALSLFLVITYILCLLWAVITPMHMMIGDAKVNLHMHDAWTRLMPGFHWAPLGFLIGLVWAYLYGWYIALIYVPLFNFFHRKSDA